MKNLILLLAVMLYGGLQAQIFIQPDNSETGFSWEPPYLTEITSEGESSYRAYGALASTLTQEIGVSPVSDVRAVVFRNTNIRWGFNFNTNFTSSNRGYWIVGEYTVTGQTNTFRVSSLLVGDGNQESGFRLLTDNHYGHLFSDIDVYNNINPYGFNAGDELIITFYYYPDYESTDQTRNPAQLVHRDGEFVDRGGRKVQISPPFILTRD